MPPKFGKIFFTHFKGTLSPDLQKNILCGCMISMTLSQSHRNHAFDWSKLLKKESDMRFQLQVFFINHCPLGKQWQIINSWGMNTLLRLCSFDSWGTNTSLCLCSFDSWGTNTSLCLCSFDSWGTNTLVCLRSFDSLGTNKFVILRPFDSWGTNIFVSIKKKSS